MDFAGLGPSFSISPIGSIDNAAANPTFRPIPDWSFSCTQPDPDSLCILPERLSSLSLFWARARSFSLASRRIAAAGFLGVINARGIGIGRGFRGGEIGVSVDVGERGRARVDTLEFDLGIREVRAVLAGEDAVKPYCPYISVPL
jgi:hypothetical protein